MAQARAAAAEQAPVVKPVRVPLAGLSAMAMVQP